LLVVFEAEIHVAFDVLLPYLVSNEYFIMEVKSTWRWSVVLLLPASMLANILVRLEGYVSNPFLYTDYTID
jgi:hypothetical protein